MKKPSIVFLFFFVFSACSKQPQEYPNIQTDQIGSFLKWNTGYSSVKKILTEDFGLQFSKENELSENNKIGKMYQFTGGKINDVGTEFWNVILEHDSLIIIMVSIATGSPEETKKVFDKLTTGCLSDDIKYPNEGRWYFQQNGKRLSEIQILKYPDDKGIFLTFFRPFINEVKE